MSAKLTWVTDLNVFDKVEKKPDQQGSGAEVWYRKDLAPGSAQWSRTNGETGDVTGLYFICPCGCGSWSHITVATQRDAPQAWTWDGNLETPTLNPSVRKLYGCGWHGWLKAGVWETC